MELSTDWQVYSPSTLLHADSEAQYINMVLAHYQEALVQDDEAQRYLLATCGYLKKQTIDTFKLGFVNRTLPEKLAKLDTYEGEMLRGLLQRTGLMKANGRETFLGMLFVPVFDNSGRLIAGYGHRIAKYVSRDVPFSEYFVTHDAVLFNEKALFNTSSLILCSSPFDVICLEQAGVKHAIAVLDYKQFNDEHVKRLRASNIKNIVIAFIRNAQGDRYYAHVRRKLNSVGISATKLTLKTGESIHSMCAKQSWFSDVLCELGLDDKRVKEQACQTKLH